MMKTRIHTLSTLHKARVLLPDDELGGLDAEGLGQPPRGARLRLEQGAYNWCAIYNT
jgi:hypothetical protein